MFFLCGTLTNLWVRAIAVNSTFFSDETHVWDTHMSLKCFFFYALHSRMYGYELLPSIQPSSWTKLMFGIHKCLSDVFFYAVHSRIYGYELLPSIQPSSWTKLMFGIHKCLSDVFSYAVHSRIYGYELLPSLVSARKVTFGSTVSCKWTRQLPYLNSINSSFSLN